MFLVCLTVVKEGSVPENIYKHHTGRNILKGSMPKEVYKNTKKKPTLITSPTSSWNSSSCSAHSSLNFLVVYSFSLSSKFLLSMVVSVCLKQTRNRSYQIQKVTN